MKKLVIFFLSLFVLSGSLALSAYAADVSIDVDGVTRTFVYQEPAGTPPAGGWPVIVLFHGALGSGNDWFISLINWRFRAFKDDAVQRGYAIIAPDALWRSGGGSGGFFSWIPGPRWNVDDLPPDNEDIDFVNEILNYITTSSSLDENKVYITGFSSGAGMTMLTACYLNSSIRAASINSGGYPDNFDLNLPAAGHPPMMVNHGKIDFVIQYQAAQRYYNDLVATGIEAVINLKSFWGHKWISPYDNMVLDWFDNH